MTNPPHTVTEYGIAERVDGRLRPLPHCGSWMTDRYYTDGLTGRAAALAALARIADRVPGDYELMELRSFPRAHDAGLADALSDADLAAWFRLRGVDDDEYLRELMAEHRGKTAGQLDDMYTALHGAMG